MWLPPFTNTICHKHRQVVALHTSQQHLCTPSTGETVTLLVEAWLFKLAHGRNQTQACGSWFHLLTTNSLLTLFGCVCSQSPLVPV